MNVLRSPAYVYGRTLFNNALLRTLTRYSGRTWCLDTHPRVPTRARARVHTLRAYECVFRARVRDMRSCTYSYARERAYPCTPFDAVTSERGVAAGWQPPSPLFTLRSLRSLSLALIPFTLPFSRSVALSLCPSTSAFPHAPLSCDVPLRTQIRIPFVYPRARTTCTPVRVRHTHAVRVSSGLYISGLRA